MDCCANNSFLRVWWNWVFSQDTRVCAEVSEACFTRDASRAATLSQRWRNAHCLVRCGPVKATDALCDASGVPCVVSCDSVLYCVLLVTPIRRGLSARGGANGSRYERCAKRTSSRFAQLDPPPFRWVWVSGRRIHWRASNPTSSHITPPTPVLPHLIPSRPLRPHLSPPCHAMPCPAPPYAAPALTRPAPPHPPRALLPHLTPAPPLIETHLEVGRGPGSAHGRLGGEPRRAPGEPVALGPELPPVTRRAVDVVLVPVAVGAVQRLLTLGCNGKRKQDGDGLSLGVQSAQLRRRAGRKQRSDVGVGCGVAGWRGRVWSCPFLRGG